MVKNYDSLLQKDYDIEQIVQDLKQRFPIEKLAKEYQDVYTKENPLVSVVTCTYNRGKRLVEYSLKSILEQTYQNLQIIVIGDCSTDDTDSLVSQITDNRFIYTNLPTRGVKGTDIQSSWAQCGCIPHNYALELVTGDFVTHLDDDDYMLPDRIEKLVKLIQEKKVDFIHHPFHLGVVGSIKDKNESLEVNHGKVTTSVTFYHNWFKQLPGDSQCFAKYGEPGDWNRIRRMLEIGITSARHPEFLVIKDYGDIERGTFKV